MGPNLLSQKSWENRFHPKKKIKKTKRIGKEIEITDRSVVEVEHGRAEELLALLKDLGRTRSVIGRR